MPQENEVKNENSLQRLLIIGKTWPEPTSSAAGTRMLQLIDLFLETGEWEVTFASPAQQTAYGGFLKAKAVRCCYLYPNDPKTDEFLRILKPELVIFDRFMIEEQFGWRVAQYCPQAVRILDTEDLHFLRRSRQAALEHNQQQEVNLYNAITSRELAAILRCDLSLLISHPEMQLLTDKFQFNRNHLFYLPFLYQKLPEGIFRQYPRFDQRKDFVFIGNFKHPPNQDAAFYLKEEIWPLIHQRLPEAQLKLYGAYPTGKILKLDSQSEKFLVKGRVEDVKNMFKGARVLLAPLRYGAGLKGKLFDAMENGTPSVTTEMGREGVADRKHFPGLIADKPLEIARAALSLYQDKTQWYEAQQKAYPLFSTDFNKDHFKQSFFEKLERFRKDLTAIRNQNFWQQLILHHRLQSTHYLSRWIEAKNNNTP